MNTINELNHLLLKYNTNKNQFWIISNSEIAGRGIIAKKNFEIGDVIFTDDPIILGPRCSNIKSLCVICYSTLNLRKCSKNCGLLLCSKKCENNFAHNFECNFISYYKLNETLSLNELLMLVVPIRSLALQESNKRIIRMLHKAFGPRHSFEIDLLKRNTKKMLKVDDENLMRTCCLVMDGNCHEVPIKDNDTSIRGLYPLASIMNHSCTPNTESSFDSNSCVMTVKVTVPIIEGTEITTTYCPLFISTPQRQNFLKKTKDFSCNCKRCQDDTEFGTYLSALRCTVKGCNGILMPKDKSSFWSCNICDNNLSYEKITVLRNVLNNQAKYVDYSSPNDILSFLKNNRFITTNSELAIKLKIALINIYGHREKYAYKDMSNELLTYKKQICMEILEIIDKLKLGQFRLKEFVKHEVFSTNAEITRRTNNA